MKVSVEKLEYFVQFCLEKMHCSRDSDEATLLSALVYRHTSMASLSQATMTAGAGVLQQVEWVVDDRRV